MVGNGTEVPPRQRLRLLRLEYRTGYVKSRPSKSEYADLPEPHAAGHVAASDEPTPSWPHQLRAVADEEFVAHLGAR